MGKPNLGGSNILYYTFLDALDACNMPKISICALVQGESSCLFVIVTSTGASRWWVKIYISTGPKQDVVAAPAESSK